jgi:hypothetical protein
MLINLSNHPFEKWDESQTQVATEQFGIVKDYPFPKVDPTSELNEIEKQADKIFEDIIHIYGTEISIHLMGEFVLCYQLLLRFVTKQILCYASTTQREVIMKPNGEKVSYFTFIKFRPYYLNK